MLMQCQYVLMCGDKVFASSCDHADAMHKPVAPGGATHMAIGVPDNTGTVACRQEAESYLVRWSSFQHQRAINEVPTFLQHQFNLIRLGK